MVSRFMADISFKAQPRRTILFFAGEKKTETMQLCRRHKLAIELRGIVRRNGAMSAARKCIGAASLLVGAGVILLATGGVAQAQIVENDFQSGPEHKNLSIHLGAQLPSDRDIRKGGGRIIYGIEANYKIQVVPLQNSIGEIGIGYYERNDYRLIPFTLTQIWREPGRTLFGQNYYYGGGISLNSVRFNYPDTSGNSKLLFGAHIVGGLDFGNTFFAELKYAYIFKYDGKFPGGFFPSVGMRF
jgi:hypothetical protein